MQQIQQGDLTAFAQLVNQYKSYVYTIVFRVVRVAEDAEEASQDVFVKVFQKIKTYNGESKFSTWLYAIAYRTAIDYRRKMNRSPVYADIENDHRELFIANKRTDAPIHSEDQKKFLEQAINMLNSEQALVITLYYLKEFQIKEITEIAKMTTSKVKVLLYRARKNLKEIIYTNFQNELEL